jgi:Holliday junction resolvase-like predicted endonuclease
MEYAHFTVKISHPYGITSPPNLNHSPHEKGAFAEQQVVNLLLDQSWKVHARNFRSIGCEIDIVCSKGQTLSFIEVKYKKKMPTPLTATSLGLSYQKQRSLQKGALSVLSKNPSLFSHFRKWRFDLAVVTRAFDSIHYFANCFEWVENP